MVFCSIGAALCHEGHKPDAAQALNVKTAYDRVRQERMLAPRYPTRQELHHWRQSLPLIEGLVISFHRHVLYSNEGIGQRKLGYKTLLPEAMNTIAPAQRLNAWHKFSLRVIRASAFEIIVVFSHFECVDITTKHNMDQPVDYQNSQLRSAG